MKVAAKDIVSLVSEKIAQHVGPERFQIWFANGTKFSMAENCLQVGVPNLYVGTWIESHFGTEVKSAARAVVGDEVRVTYQIDPQLFAQVRKNRLDSEADFLAKEANSEAAEAKNAPIRVRKHKRRNTAPLKTLDNFVVGETNRMAYTAAREVSRNPGKTFNPLFIHGPSGVGKTHLLQGISQGANAKSKRPRTCYLTAEQFTNQYILAVRTGSLDGFRQRYRNLDLLIIDDIHFIAAKKGTQEEFLHTFNAIDAAGKQIVMASDAHPKLICQLRQTLVNRFISGLVVRVDPPDVETRCQILEARALAMGKPISPDVCRYLAERATGNVRELEGMLISLLATASLGRAKLDLALARQVVDSQLPGQPLVVRGGDVIEMTASALHVPPADLKARKRTRAIALPRQITMYLMRKLTQLSAADIGNALGGRSHATVLAGCKKVKQLLDANAPLPPHLYHGHGPRTLRGLIQKLERLEAK